jgi:hypothetical protein
VAVGKGDGMSGGGGGGGGLPIASARPRSDRDIGGATGSTANLVSCAPAPTSLYSAATGAHQPEKRLDAPDQGAREGLDRVVGVGPGDQPNTQLQ